MVVIICVWMKIGIPKNITNVAFMEKKTTNLENLFETLKGKNKTVASVVDISLYVLSCECDNYLVCNIFMVIL